MSEEKKPKKIKMSIEQLSQLKTIHFRDQLEPYQEKWAKRIYDSLGPTLITSSFEQFEFNFCKDEHPDKELFVWDTIAVTLQRYEGMGMVPDEEKRKEVFRILLAFTVGVEMPQTDEVVVLGQMLLSVQKELIEDMENYKKGKEE